MDKNKKLIIKEPKKIYFFLFIIFSIIVLIIFAFLILGYYWDSWYSVRQIEKYYSKRALEFLQKYPEINLYDPVKGTPDAKVTIYEYSDFLCAACQNVQADLTEIENYYGNKIKVVFKGVSLVSNPESKNAMLAAYCAAEQGKFWEYKDLLYQNPAILNLEKYREYANQLVLNLTTFNQCYETQKYYPIIQQNLADALTIQIGSLPTLFINKQKVEGYYNFDMLKNIIDEQLK